MELTYRIGGVAIPNRVRLTEEGSGFVTAAERGALGTGGVIIDDPDGDLTITGWQTFTVDDANASPTRVFEGYIAQRSIGRAAREGNRVTDARAHDCLVIDLNADLQLRVLRANAAKRGVETDVARVAWLLTSEALNGVVEDNGLVSTSNPGTFLPADTRRTYANAVIGEMAPSAVKNFFVYRDVTTGDHSLFYDKDTSTAYASPIRISNVLSDLNTAQGTYYPLRDAVLERSPEDVYSGVSYGWLGDPIYVTSPANLAALGLQRDAVYDTNRIGVLATAQANAASWLNVRSGESDWITVTCLMSSTHVNLLYAGHRLQVRFSHLPGFESYTWTRVRRRSVIPENEDLWRVKLELWVPPTPATDAAVTTGGCPAIVQSSIRPYAGAGFETTTLSAAPTPGNILFAIVARRGPFVDATALTPSLTGSGTDKPFTAFGAQVNTPNSTISALIMGWRVSDGTETLLHWDQYSQQHVSLWEISGLDADPSVLATVLRADEQSAASTFSLGSFGSTGSLNFISYIWNRDFEDVDYYTLGAGWTTVYSDSSDSGRPYVEYGTASGALAATATASISVEWGGFAVALTADGCGDDPLPATGAEIANETSPTVPDGTTVLFSTVYPYQDGTLIVRVAGLWLVDADVTETDPVAGTYTLSFAPESDEIVEASYVAR